MSMEINWGIIGCGDVTEKKSGPAFNKIAASKLVAVMRRNKGKAADYAKRHQVAEWYDDADEIINHAAINAVYIATPPDSHFEYAKRALASGKMVYVEKPVTINAAEARALSAYVEQTGGKLVVAHYRRQQPYFKKIKSLLDQKMIGNVKQVQLRFWRKNITTQQLEDPRFLWRVDPAISGGGLFHDIAPHQLDMLYYLFGDAQMAYGLAENSNALYRATDEVAALISFNDKILFSGSWCFDCGQHNEQDTCDIIGDNGSISFSFFDGNEINVNANDLEERFVFEKLMHVQQPMIDTTVAYFRGEAVNPCPIRSGIVVMELMEKITAGRGRQ